MGPSAGKQLSSPLRPSDSDGHATKYPDLEEGREREVLAGRVSWHPALAPCLCQGVDLGI